MHKLLEESLESGQPTEQSMDFNPSAAVADAELFMRFAKLKADFSAYLRELRKHSELFRRLLSPTELLSPEECEIVCSKDFSKLVLNTAKASASLAHWHSQNTLSSVEEFFQLSAGNLQILSENSGDKPKEPMLPPVKK